MGRHEGNQQGKGKHPRAKSSGEPSSLLGSKGKRGDDYQNPEREL